LTNPQERETYDAVRGPTRGAERSDMGRAALIASLREGAAIEVERELRSRSPFLSWVDAERHASFVTSREVVFVFEGGESTAQQVSALEDLSAWGNPTRWSEWVKGRPRSAAPVFWFERGRDLEGVFFGPTPGPGYSEGGDLVLP
jgi:hypothetical protein